MLVLVLEWFFLWNVWYKVSIIYSSQTFSNCFLKNGNRSAIKASHTQPTPHLAVFGSSQHDCNFVMLSCQREQKSPRSSSSCSPQEVYPFSKLHFHERGVLNKRLISEHVCFIMLGGKRLHMLNHIRLKSLLSRPFNFLLVYVLVLLVIRKSPTSGSSGYKKHTQMKSLFCLIHSCHSSVILFLSLTPAVSRRWQQSWETGRRDASPLVCPHSFAPPLPLHAALRCCFYILFASSVVFAWAPDSIHIGSGALL